MDCCFFLRENETEIVTILHMKDVTLQPNKRGLRSERSPTSMPPMDFAVSVIVGETVILSLNSES